MDKTKECCADAVCLNAGTNDSVSAMKAKKKRTARADHAGKGLQGLDLEPKRGSAIEK